MFVFVFFGVVATVGSAYVQPAGWSGVVWLVSVAVGCLATALLVANNLRDIPTDRTSGKRTLAVRMGDAKTRWLFIILLVVPYVIAGIVSIDRPWSLLALLSLPLALGAVRPVLAKAAGRDLIPVLEATGKTQLVYGVLLAIGLWVG